jgi:hypothetical protein
VESTHDVSIILKCPYCKKEKSIRRKNDDPETATVVEFCCLDCYRGGDEEKKYLDKEGNTIKEMIVSRRNLKKLIKPKKGPRLIERRKRGIFGKLMLAVFWLANGFMALWLFSATQQWSKMPTAVTEAEKVGQGLGITAGLGVLLSIWACVAIVTGLLAYMTRGHKEITEIDV